MVLDAENSKKKISRQGPKILFLISLTADVASLVGFATSIIKPNNESFFMHPALWLAIQFIIAIIGSVSLGYAFLISINNKYKNRTTYIPKDIKNSLLLVVYFGWFALYLVWLTTYILIGSSNVPLNWLIGIFTAFGSGWLGLVFSRWSCLLHRTLVPESQITIEIDANGDLVERK